ncbi:MAG: alanine--glyoxylate aminotransferase family protein [Halobacteria archaeon]
MRDDFLLMNPGPVPLPERVREAMSETMVSHRSSDFEEVYTECKELLEDVFQTDDDVLIFNSSGSGAMEAAIANTCGEDDVVVSLVNGKFGRRLRRIAERYAGEVRELDIDWGESFDLDEVRELVDEDVDAVTMVHNETSSGVLNPAEEVGQISDGNDALFLMDGVTSIGGDDVPVDDWKVDVAIVGSQKCLGAPPGLSAVAISDDAKVEVDGEEAPFYFDIDKHLGKLPDDQTPFTSSVSLFRGLREALRIIDEEGMDERVERHRKLSRAVREAIRAWGVELFADLREGSDYSNTVTGFVIPEETSDEEIRGTLSERGISISGGQAHLGGDIIRIATMANCGEEEVLRVVGEIQDVLEDSDFQVDGDGVKAAEEVL